MIFIFTKKKHKGKPKMTQSRLVLNCVLRYNHVTILQNWR